MQVLTEEQIHLMEAGRELDALISEYVFDKPCLGFTACSNYDGCWIVSGREHDENSGIDKHPVRVNSYIDCQCSIIDENKRHSALCVKCFGHYTHCLEIVSFYSTDMNDAWQIIDKITKSLDEIITDDGEKYGHWTLDRLGFDCCKDGKLDTDGVHGQYRCHIVKNVNEEDRVDVYTTGNTVALAICKCALLAKLKD